LWFAFCFSRSYVFTFLPVVLSLCVVDLFANRLFREVLWLLRKIFTEGFELNRDEHLDRAIFIFGVLFFVSNQDPSIPEVVRHVRLWFSCSNILTTLGACPQNLGSIGVKTEEIRCFLCDSRLFSGRPDAATVASDAAAVAVLICHHTAILSYLLLQRIESGLYCFTSFELVSDQFQIPFFALVC
jgi:hypothetical protein